VHADLLGERVVLVLEGFELRIDLRELFEQGQRAPSTSTMGCFERAELGVAATPLRISFFI
jgi:hypothetical protein